MNEVIGFPNILFYFWCKRLKNIYYLLLGFADNWATIDFEKAYYVALTRWWSVVTPVWFLTIRVIFELFIKDV